MLICIIFIHFISQDHHDDIRQEQKWEMQALSTQVGVHSGGSCSSNSSSASTDEHEHNLGCDSLTCETGSASIVDQQQHATAMSPSSSCGNHSVETCNVSRQHQLNFNNNTTIAISNNNNCDTIKNNNNQTHVTTPIEIVNEVESAVLIDQQNALLRGVNIGMKHPPPTFFKGNF